EDQPDVALLEGEGLPVAQPGLQARLRQRAESQGVGEEVGRREGVAHVELDVIDSPKHANLLSAVKDPWLTRLRAAGRRGVRRWRRRRGHPPRAPPSRATRAPTPPPGSP